MSDHEHDGRLMAGAQAGDPRAFAELYDRHASTMLALGLRVLGVRKEAEDLLHDVFLEAWEHLHQYDPARGSVRGWLLLRMRSRALDRRGSAAFARGVALAEKHEHEMVGKRESIDADQLAVRNVLAAMPEPLREVLHMTYFLGMTAQEIGAQTGVPEGTVRSRLARGLALLEDRLKDGAR